VISFIFCLVSFSSKSSFVNNGINWLVLFMKPTRIVFCWLLSSLEFCISFEIIAKFLFSCLIWEVLFNSLSSIGNWYFNPSSESLTLATWQSSLADFG